jgi:glycosyltransferase involved in cell wall biosynthesis
MEITVRKKVLIIAFNFPPAGGAEVQRIAKFAEYLAEYDWTPVILTSVQDSYIKLDNDHYQRIKNKVIVERVKSHISPQKIVKLRKKIGANLPWRNLNNEISWKSSFVNFFRTWFMIPDSQIFWIIPVLFKLSRILSKFKPDVIMATSPPYSILLLGVITKILSKKPLVLDYRDPWTQSFGVYRKGENKFRLYIERWLEKIVLRLTNLVISVTPPIIEDLQSLDKSNLHSKFRLIYNGFDKEDFKSVIPKTFNHYTIVYTGKILSNWYSALPFLKGFRELIKENPDLTEKIQIKFIGVFDDPMAIDFIKKYGLTQNISILGHLSHSECLSYQLGADLLLLIYNNEEIGRIGISTKLFEYMGAKKPILALTDKNSLTAKIMNKSKMGKTVSSITPKEIAKELKDFYSGINPYCINEEILELFSRQKQTEQLATMLNELITS